MIRRTFAALPLIASSAMLIVGLSLYYVRLAGEQSLIVLHFIARDGADFWGTKTDVLLMLVAGAFVLFSNTTLAGILWNRNRALAQAINVATSAVMLLILIAICGIIAVN